MGNNTEDIIKIVENFGIDTDACTVKPLGNGLINTTFLIDCGGKRYVLQRINNNIFTDVEALQNNIGTVTDHIRRKLEAVSTDEIERKCLRFLHAPSSGKTYIKTPSGYWRLMHFIEGAVTHESVNPAHAYAAGVAFGQFESMVADLPADMPETIPHFHDMAFRLRQLEESIKKDTAGRVESVTPLIDAIKSDAEYACTAERLEKEGKLSRRICHCDTKVNNILFDTEGNILCVIDLDTVMPGFIFSDFGDFLRTAANPMPEDTPEIDSIDFDTEIFTSFTKGYLESTKSFLTPAEKSLLPYGAFRFAYMQAVRFLIDYLDGDTYYTIKYSDHNLVRAKAQLRLASIIKKKLPKLQAIVDSL